MSACSFYNIAEAVLSISLWHASLTGLYLLGALRGAAMVARAGSPAVAARTAAAGVGRQRAAWRAHLPGQDLHRHSSSLQKTVSRPAREGTSESLMFCCANHCSVAGTRYVGECARTRMSRWCGPKRPKSWVLLGRGPCESWPLP